MHTLFGLAKIIFTPFCFPLQTKLWNNFENKKNMRNSKLKNKKNKKNINKSTFILSHS